MASDPSTGRHRQLAAGIVLFASSCAMTACTAGYSSSFSQAPIFLAEAADEQGTIADEPGGASDFADGDFEAGIPTYLAVDGNAVLPVRSVAIPTTIDAAATLLANNLPRPDLPGSAAPGSGIGLTPGVAPPPIVAVAGLSPAPPLLGDVLSGVAGTIAVVPPVAVAVSPPLGQVLSGIAGTIVVAPPVAVAVSLATTGALGGVAAAIPTAVTAVPSVAGPPVTQAVDMVGAIAAPAVQALVTRGVMLSGPSAGAVQAVTAPGLLGTTAADIMRMCGLRKCGG